MPKQATVTEAKALQDQGSIYVDVRSQPEFERGHPAGAVNIPLLDLDPARPGAGLAPNPDFVQVMQANFPPDAPLLIGCQAGGRSMRASMMLETFGFTNVTNVKGGYGGMRDPMGRLVDAGWAESGLPCEEGAPSERCYETLAAKLE